MVANGTPNPQVRVRIFHPVQNGDITQLVECQTENLMVTGSNPVITTNGEVAQLV